MLSTTSLLAVVTNKTENMHCSFPLTMSNAERMITSKGIEVIATLPNGQRSAKILYVHVCFM